MECGQARLVLRTKSRVHIQALAEERVPVEGHPLHGGRQAENGYGAQGLHHLQGLVERLHAAHALYHHVRALAVRQVQHSVRGPLACNVYRLVDAHAAAGLKSGSHGLHRDDAMRAQPSQQEVVEQAYGALPQHHHGLAQQRGQLSRAEYHRSQLLHHQQVGGRNVCRQLQQELRVDELVACEYLGAPDVGRGQDQVALLIIRVAGVDYLADSLVAGVAMLQRKLVGIPAHVHDVKVAAA